MDTLHEKAEAQSTSQPPMQTNTHPQPPEAMRLFEAETWPDQALSLLPQLPLSGSTQKPKLCGLGPGTPRSQILR